MILLGPLSLEVVALDSAPVNQSPGPLLQFPGLAEYFGWGPRLSSSRKERRSGHSRSHAASEAKCWHNIGVAQTAQATISVADLARLLERLIRGPADSLDAYVTSFRSDVRLPPSEARLHFELLSLDGNGLPRGQDLARALVDYVVDYAIPRSEINRAQDLDKKHNTTRYTTGLATKAAGLFTRLKLTGEAGELLLYLLAQSRLRLPQLLCKMPLKTNTAMNIHGTDGIHAGFDVTTGTLALYWGESKLYDNLAAGISSCLDSIRPFLISGGPTQPAYARDLQLLRANLDLDPPELQDALLRYLDKDSPDFNRLAFRGVCLVGFDHAVYPAAPNAKTRAALATEVGTLVGEWAKTVSSNLTKRTPLDSIHLEIFMLPLPSVASFRATFVSALRNE